MKRHRFALTLLMIGFGALPMRAGIDPTGADAPPEIVAHARQLVAQKDFAGIEAMMAQVDAQYGDNHSLGYFRTLLGISHAILPQYVKPSRAEYSRLWLDRKLIWKILLTPYSRIEDALQVQQMKNFVAGFSTPFPWDSFEEDQDQFIAMRKDAVALLEAYGDSLRTRMIAGYKQKPERGLENGAFRDEGAALAAIAKAKKEEPQLIQNEYENTEQSELSLSLRLLGESAVLQIKDDFCWPPVDDETINALLDALPPSPLGESREHILAELAELRRAKIAQLEKSKGRSNAAEGKTP